MRLAEISRKNFKHGTRAAALARQDPEKEKLRRQKLSEKAKGKNNSQYGRYWVHKDGKSKQIQNKSELIRYLEDGWHRGQKPSKWKFSTEDFRRGEHLDEFHCPLCSYKTKEKRKISGHYQSHFRSKKTP